MRAWAFVAPVDIAACSPASHGTVTLVPQPATEPPPPQDLPLTAVGAKAPLRIAVDVAALRATPDGVRLLGAIADAPSAKTFREASGVDIFADGTWLVAYGTNFMEPKASSLVVAHRRDPLGPHTEHASDDEMLLRPQPGIVATVPRADASRIGADLKAPLDPALTNGTLVRLTMRDASFRFPILTREIERVSLRVVAAPNGGFDVNGVAECATVETCGRALPKLQDTTMRMAGLVRDDLRAIFENVRKAFVADGARIAVRLRLDSGDVERLTSAYAAMAPR